MALFDRSYTTFCQSAIVSITLSSKIDVIEYSDLAI